MEISQLGMGQISTSSPTGEDCRLSSAFQELQDLVDPSPGAQATRTDWKRGVELASGILAEQSKDLLVAAYLVLCLWRARGMDGLVLGLGVFRDLLNNYWSDAYPPVTRIRARISAIEWLWDKTAACLRSRQKQPQPQELVSALRETVKAIDSLAGEKLGKDAPGANVVLKTIGAIPVAGEAPGETGLEDREGSKPAARSGPGASAGARDAQAAAELGEEASPEEARRALAAALRNLRDLAAWHVAHDPANPLGLRLARAAAWMRLERLPPASGGRTQVPPPERHLVELFDNLRDAGKWKDLLVRVEACRHRFAFWLDLDRLSCEALDGLGKGHLASREAVRAEVASFLARLPDLMHCSFSDGTPFADSRTLEWIAELAMPAGSGAKTSAPAFSIPALPEAVKGADSSQLAEIAQQAEALRAGGKLKDAVALIEGKLRQALSARESFLLRLALCRLLGGGDSARVVWPHAAHLLEDIDRHDLTAWDPGLAMEVFVVACRLWGADQSPEAQERAAATRERLALMSPAAAIGLDDPAAAPLAPQETPKARPRPAAGEMSRAPAGAVAESTIKSGGKSKAKKKAGRVTKKGPRKKIRRGKGGG